MKHIKVFEEFIEESVNIDKVEKYADKVMDPIDVEFTKHFYDQLTRTEHTKEITDAELIGFFKRLAKKKKDFDKFKKEYDQFVVKDERSDINIPFKKRVDQIIAKTVMRKPDFKTSNAKYTFESLVEGLAELDVTSFRSLFDKMPKELQKRVYNLKGFDQRADKHPEGNVLKHTITVVDRSLKDDDIDIAIAAMFHDIGKDETAGVHPKKGHITHFGHEKVSAKLAKDYKDWIESVGGNAANVYYIVKNHMRYKQLSDMRPEKQKRLQSFRAFDKLGKFSKHDRGGLK
jgi:hypothetical protein